MEGYHTSVTLDVTFNPYLPLPGRLLQVLASYGPPGTTIETCNRDLAQAAQCSAGAVPGALRTLEADGHIERITSPRGSLIVLSERSGMPDRLETRQTSDQHMADRSIGGRSANPIETPDRSSERSTERSAMPDPPTPPIRKKHDLAQQQPHARDLRFLLQEHGADRDRPERVFPDQWRQIQAANPGYTAHDFMRELAIASGRPDVNDPVALVVGVRVRGEAVYQPKELTHERPTRQRRDAPDRRQRPTGRSAPQPEQPALSREYLQSRGRRGDRLRDLPGRGEAAGG
jgi:hypothetical protein